MVVQRIEEPAHFALWWYITVTLGLCQFEILISPGCHTSNFVLLCKNETFFPYKSNKYPYNTNSLPIGIQQSLTFDPSSFVHVALYCADSSQCRHVTCILKTWLSMRLLVLHVGDTAVLSECRFSLIRSGTRNQGIQCLSHDRLQMLRLQSLARHAFVALLLVLFLFCERVY